MSLRQHIARNNIVPFNPKIANGIAGTMLKDMVPYLDMLFEYQAREEGYPDGLTYEGIEMATPEEAYEEFSKTKFNRTRTVRKVDKIKGIQTSYEVSAYDFYAVKLQLGLRGEFLKPRIVFIPYPQYGGLMKMRGSTYAISPILADIAMSVKNDSIFVPFIKGKINVWRFPHNVLVNGNRESSMLAYAKIWHNIKYPDNGKTSLAHYLFTWFGFKGTLRKFCKVDVTVGFDDTITPESHPLTEWDIFSSAGAIVKGNNSKTQEHSAIMVAIRKEDRTLLIDQIITAFFYCVDRFPERILPEYVDDTYVWKLLLGKIIHSHTGEGKLVGGIETHLETVEGYICQETRRQYADDGVIIRHPWDLFVYVMKNYHNLIANSEESSMYGKRLKFLRYIGESIIHKFNKFIYALKKESKQKPLTQASVTKALNSGLSAKVMFNINNKHGEVNPHSTSSDNCIFMYMHVVLQDDATKGVHKTLKLNDPKKLIHVSLADAGRYCAPKKSEPTGRGLNPCAVISDDWDIVQRPELAETLNLTNEKLRM